MSDKVTGSGSTTQEAVTGAFARTAKAKNEAKLAAADAEPTQKLTPENYDVRKEAQKHYAKYGHELLGWTNAVDGVKDFWHTACAHCGLGIYARWRGSGEEISPGFGCSDAKGHTRPCTGQIPNDDRGAGRFSATE